MTDTPPDISQMEDDIHNQYAEICKILLSIEVDINKTFKSKCAATGRRARRKLRLVRDGCHSLTSTYLQYDKAHIVPNSVPQLTKKTLAARRKAALARKQANADTE